jgi:hypothetical protein
VITIVAVPAEHGPVWLWGTHDVCGFVLTWDGQKHGALYISDDTVYFDEMGRLTNHFKIGTALLHLGAVHFWPPYPRQGALPSTQPGRLRWRSSLVWRD